MPGSPTSEIQDEYQNNYIGIPTYKAVSRQVFFIIQADAEPCQAQLKPECNLMTRSIGLENWLPKMFLSERYRKIKYAAKYVI